MLTNPDPGLINEDIQPVPLDERHWNVMSMASLWVGMVVCVPTYMLAASLISQGMSWSQAIFTVMLGNVIVLIPMVLNGHPGTKYGIPFPVLARASWGIQGAHIPSILRALVACGWFGIQTWIGGSAIYQLLNVIVGDSLVGSDLPVLGINLAETLCFLAFWGIQLVIVYKGVESIRVLETLAAPFLIIMGLALLLWAYIKAGGFGDMLTKPSAFDVGQPKEGQFLSVFFPSLTAMVGFWATLSLNIPDFTRYAKSQRDQVLGQALGLPTTMTLFAFIGVAVTSATVTIFGEAIWDPTVLLGKMGGGFAVVVSLFALSVATLSTNIAANVVSPANVFINVSPQKVTFRMGAMITAGLGVAIFPWKLIESTGGYIFTWLIGYSALLGPIGGILIVDYFLLRGTRLSLNGLYRTDGPYRYAGGFNPIAVVAFIVAVIPNVPGFLQAAGAIEGIPEILSTLYTYAWFLGFGIAGLLYFVGMKVTGWGGRDQAWDEAQAQAEPAAVPEPDEQEDATVLNAPTDQSDAATEAGDVDTKESDAAIDPTYEAVTLNEDEPDVDAVPEILIEVPDADPLDPTIDASSVSPSAVANLQVYTDDDEITSKQSMDVSEDVLPPRVEIADPNQADEDASAPSDDAEEKQDD